VTLATSRALPPARADAGESWLARVRAGMSHALGNPAVRRIFSAHAVALVCAAMISPVEVIWAKEVLGGGNSAYGIVLSAWGAGTLLTGLVLVSLWRRLPVVARIPLGAGTMGVGYVVMTFATSLPVGALGCFIGGLGNGFYFVSVIQAIQERTADEYQGRVMGLLESTTAGGYGVGFLLAGAITALTSVRVTFAATAVGVILASIWMATLLPRHPADSPESRSSATTLATESS
jgi:predicted MFS family arabinose efflux permease